MRELTNNELEQVSGGNFFYGMIGIVSAFEAGKAFGGYVNDYNRKAYNMSFGEAIYKTVHE